MVRSINPPQANLAYVHVFLRQPVSYCRPTHARIYDGAYPCLFSPRQGGVFPCTRILTHVLGLFAVRSRAQIRAHSRGDRASDAAHRRQAERRRTLHPRTVPLRVTDTERGAHAPVGERVQHARRAPAFARRVGGARRRDVGPLRDDARPAGSRDGALGYHAGDDAVWDDRAASRWREGEEAAGCEVSDLFGVD